MIKINSITGRIFVGVLVGLLVGIISMTFLFMNGYSFFSLFGLGTLLLFVMMGFTLGLVGGFDHHPLLKFKMKWQIRGIVAGAIFSLIYVLLGYKEIEIIMSAISFWGFSFVSPFWVIVDGVVTGLVMAFLETKIAGEGSKLPLV